MYLALPLIRNYLSFISTLSKQTPLLSQNRNRTIFPGLNTSSQEKIIVCYQKGNRIKSIFLGYLVGTYILASSQAYTQGRLIFEVVLFSGLYGIHLSSSQSRESTTVQHNPFEILPPKKESIGSGPKCVCLCKSTGFFLSNSYE